VWVHDFDGATGPEVTLPPEQAVVMIASPKIQTDHAKTAVNIWCGMTCGGGYGLDLERSSTGDWSVTGQFGGFVS
jgi:hypothetical protein